MNVDRVRALKDGSKREGKVVYWMSRDQRVEDNWALLYAQELALQMKAPLAVIFCLVPQFLNATLRQFAFTLMPEGTATRNVRKEKIIAAISDWPLTNM